MSFHFSRYRLAISGLLVAIFATPVLLATQAPGGSEAADDLLIPTSELVPAAPTAPPAPAVDSDAPDVVPAPPPIDVVSKDIPAEDATGGVLAPDATNTLDSKNVKEEQATEVEPAVEEAPKLDPAIELMRLRQENASLKEQLRRIDSNVVERDIKIGELQEEISKVSNERNAISEEYQETRAELTEKIAMLETKTRVLEQSIEQHEQSQNQLRERTSTRAARYQGVVNRYLEPGVEFYPSSGM